MKVVGRIVTILALILVFGAVSAEAQAITVTTFAGPQEVPGVSDGIGRDARFRDAIGVAVDRQRNVYVADQYNLSIRKVSPSGAVTTLAGLFYTPGQQNGSGSVARFSFPEGVATDAADNVYVADTVNGRIRKITPQGMVSTVAGAGSGSADGPAATARFQRPAGVAAAADGTVYVADTGNHTIRKISASGEVTTLAGTAGAAGSANGVGSSARFYYPNSVALDQGGNLYVADRWNQVIRKVTPEGTVSTFCGGMGLRGSADGPCSTARFAYPGAIAITAIGEFYIADTFNYCIRKIDTNGRVSTVAGSPNSEGLVDGSVGTARFYLPEGIAVDGGGAIYVMDGTLRKISDGQVTTIAGMSRVETRLNADGVGAAARFETPAGIAADDDGNLYVADDYTVRKVTSAAEVSTIAGRSGSEGNANGAAGTATFSHLRGIAVVGASVYVVDSDNNAIKKISGGTVTTFAGSNTPLEGDADGPGSVARFRHPKGTVADGAGNLYVADWGNHTIRKISPSGVVSTVAGAARVSGSADGSGSAARFNRPLGVAVDGAGNVYVSDSENYTIRKISPSGEVTTLAGLAGSRGFLDGVGSAARFKSLNAIAASPAGTVYVGDDTTVRKIDPDGTVTTVAGTPTPGIDFGYLEGDGTADGTGKDAQFIGAGGLVVLANGNLFVTDNGTIRLGRPAIPDVATGVVTSTNPEVLQLDTSTQNATGWEWRVMRRPAGARANLSSPTARNPTFRSDVPGLFVFRLTASGPAGARVSYLGFMSNATPAPPPGKRRSARH
jgi:hypothetical protein